MHNSSHYDPLKHHRRSIRLVGYDYSQPGLFFITICIKNRLCLLGEIVDQQMILNNAGIMVEKWYAELEHKFPDIKCHEHMTMPNHFHCIIENVGAVGADVGADLCVCPDNSGVRPDGSVGADLCVCPDDSDVRPDGSVGADLCVCPNDSGGHTGQGGHIGPPLPEPIFGDHRGSPLGNIVQWFKTMSTNEYIRHVKSNHWPAFEKKLWQRNYWEHIIRSEQSCFAIAEYINSNPLYWDNDSINPANEKKS